MAEEATNLAWGYELEDWIDIGSGSTEEWIKFTELNTWDLATEPTEYTPAWLDRKTQPKFVQSTSSTITFEKDTVVGGALEEWAIENRNKTDVPCRVARVYTWLGTDGSRTADIGDFLFTPNAFGKSNAGQPVITGGTLNLASDGWTEGTWSGGTKKFTPGDGASG